MVTIRNKGNFDKLDKYFTKSLRIIRLTSLEKIVEECVEKLKKATPVDTGLTANSWTYEITREGRNVRVEIYNRNIQNGVNVALLLEYGHGTANGAWIEGKNYISPIVFETYNRILNEGWEEIKGL